MDGNVIFLTLTGFILALFASVFLMVYTYDRTQRFAGWLAVAYTCGLVAFFLDVQWEVVPLYGVLITNTAFWGTSGAILAAACARTERTFPLRWFVILLVVGYGTNLWFSTVSPDTMWRSSLSNVIAGLIIALGLPALYSQGLRKIDRAVFVVLAIIAVTDVARPLLAFGIFNAGDNGANYASSTYALVLHLTSAISALAGAVVMLLAAGLDMVDKLYRVSVTDHLTGLRNRRGLDERLAELEKTEELTGRGVIALDIDGFKAINDNFGHAVGDAILKRLGACLANLIPPIGEVSRTGGEEFLILLNEPCSPSAVHFAEQIRSAVALIRHPELEDGHSVTASFGVALIRPTESSRPALRRADIALYAAKDGGRNCVRTADEINLETRTG